eukprot:COSAG02_NODE_57412_length_280_cov_1.762431_1_plen_20_part_10
MRGGVKAVAMDITIANTLSP